MKRVEKHQIVIDIAAYGWEGESWRGFYPADLPEDWHLDFYSNEFRSVVVPLDMWQGITADMAEEWSYAVHAEFRFYFEATDGQITTPEQSVAIELLGTQWGGWACRNSAGIDDAIPSIWYGGETAPRQMREAIEQLHAALGHNKRGVIVMDTTNEPWQVVSDMRQLVELMGYG